MTARPLDGKGRYGQRMGSDDVQAGRQGAVWGVDRTIAALSHKLMVDHYERRDLAAVVSALADDFTWIGPLDKMYACSAEEMIAMIEGEYGTRVQIVDEEWGVHALAGVRVAIGRYGAVLEGTEVEDVVFRQSVTMVWKLTSAGPRVAHLHVSNSYDIPPRIDQPFSSGEDGISYTIDTFAQSSASPRRRLRFKTSEGDLRFIAEDRILCLVVRGRGVLVMHEGGVVHSSEGLERLEERLSSSFVRTHRSCLVNAPRAAGVKRFSVTMDDGSACPIAQRRYLEVVKALEQAAQRELLFL